ncbi:site-specific integrase [Lutibacter sp. A64]|uniref:site-specific integrase n=1 Tax=Lutibacter sp. A64 TaxID=2918526 RepID=UPI001F05E7C2|nr:site-specific integrase [Lutibacter sp. A64]UMB53914.1 site-specific integrase [Lutibacter sp. A64]
MKTSTTFSILIWVNTSRVKDNQAKLFARVTVNQKRVSISLKRSVDISTWDKSKSQVKGNTQKARITNSYIQQVKAKLFQSYQFLKLEGKLITAQAIKSNFLSEDEVYKSMEDLITYHNEKMACKLHKDTMRNYKSSQNYLRKFIKKEYKTNNVYLKDLNYSFVIGFEDFLRSYQPIDHQRKIGNNTVMKHIQRLRKMVTMAFKMEWIVRDPFVKFKSLFIKSKREFLSEEDLQLLEEFTSSINRLELVRDLFVFSCYTGIAYIDIPKHHTYKLQINLKLFY